MMMTTELPGTFTSVSEVENISFANVSFGDSCQRVSLIHYHTTLIPAIYSIIFLLGFIGNILVALVLCQQIGFKTVASTYILNLVISDILFLLSLPLWAVYYYLRFNWIFGTLMCKVCGSVLTINLFASLFFITCMSVDRYLAIVHPFRSQSSRSVCRARAVSCLVWLLALLSSFPSMYFRNTYYLKELKVTACIMHYPDENNAMWAAAMALMKNTLGFLIPFTIIATCYIGIGKHLLRTPDLDKSTNNRDRALKMVIAVVLAFFLCWFPFHVVTFLDVLTRFKLITSCEVKSFIDTVMPFTLCVAFMNSSINPFLYSFLGNHFREQFHHLYDRRQSSLSQKRGSISTRLSSFSRKLSDLKDMGVLETFTQSKGHE
ncbi:type-2 angiotensin II receptor [Amia ocellicauda]|uniref:type-2 angiotensin II receptor n=1 Tax=Amia ocellicauda TaxID=2972642 RepID=UPI003464E5B7